MHTAVLSAALLMGMAGSAAAQAPDSALARPARPRPTASAPT